MSDFSRRPTVEEIEQLREQVRRDPGSPAFVRLGEAYLALGRPSDAIEVATRGLQANPDSIAGRMMIGRAHVMLHQWKQAQTELLKLVKADRNHAAGFALLGEVLLRRNDLERALPVLQHAQNLNPTNPYVEDLLKRARTGQAPDAPPPIPAPRDPERSVGAAFSSRAASQDPLTFGIDEPTRVAGGMTAGLHEAPPSYPPLDAYPPAYPPSQPGPAAYAPASPPRQSGSGASRPPAAPPMSAAPSMTADPGAKTIMAGIGTTGPVPPAPSMPPAPRPTAPPMAAAPPAPAAPPAAPLRASLAAPSVEDKKPKSSVSPDKMPPPGPPAGVRPRVVSMEKPTEAARQALLQAADVGDYLNTLLTQGLLNVPAVQARIEPVTTKPAKRWGRSAVRTFVFLFALLAVGLGGGGYWVYRAELQRKEEVDRRLVRTDSLLETATYADVQSALGETAGALERDPNNLVAMAKFARVGAVSALLYGMAPSKAAAAMSRARAGIQPGQPGWSDIAFAQAALTMATLGDETEGTPADRLSDTRSSIDGWLAEHPGDGWMHWLKGLAQLEVGDLSGAAQSFEAAEAAGKGPVIATIYRADLQLDAGDLEGAMKRYEQALERAKNHPLAVLGKALVRIDRADDPADILGEINNTLDEDLGPRVNAYRALAFAMSYLWLGWDYDQFNQNLAKAEGIREPRFLARVALAELANGRLTGASETRNRIVWYSKEPKEKHPLVAAVDAHVQWLTGLSGPAYEVVKDVQSLRARHMRGRALYELGRMDEALAEFTGILELAPEDWEAQTWHAAARMIIKTGKERQDADDELKALGRKQASKLVRYVHGTAWLRIGNKREARLRFDDSLEDMTKERPNPVAERSHTALAELDLAENKVDAAKGHLDDAVEINPGYLPALGLLGRVQLLRGQHAEAVATLRPLLDEPELASATLDLAFAEALVGGGNADDQARQQARAVLLRAKEKGASAEEVARVAALIGEEMLQELGIQPQRAGGRNRRRNR
jgi:tetratricopeptide (TPR) repeat protein